MSAVFFLHHLFSGNANFIGIIHDNLIYGHTRGIKTGLIFSTQKNSNPSCQTPEYLILRINFMFHSSRTALTPLERNPIGYLGDYCLFYKKLFLGIINPVFLSNGANSFAASGGLRTARTV